jgi:glutamate N-acetyltransferase/amino-acid N-acetyltransferase
MAKTDKDWRLKIGKLKAKVEKLRARLDERGSASAPAAKVKAANPVSPLAPKGGFPALPVIAGVEFAAVEAGVRYANRKDVMLVRLAPGSTVAGAFTRSTTRAACVLDCQAKLAMEAPELRSSSTPAIPTPLQGPSDRPPLMR